jgi:nucleoside-diphosphate-sugar epimerase
VTSVVRSFLTNAPFIDLTEGRQKRRFIYIDDAIEAIMFIIRHAASVEQKYSSYDISTKKSITIKEFVLAAKRLTGNTATQLNFGAIPYRTGEEMEIETDVQLLEALGWQPRFSVEQGLERMIEQERMKLL